VLHHIIQFATTRPTRVIALWVVVMLAPERARRRAKDLAAA
jgi:hypothetical protein